MSARGSALGSWVCHMNKYMCIYNLEERRQELLLPCGYEKPKTIKIVLKTALTRPQCRALRVLILNPLITADSEI